MEPRILYETVHGSRAYGLAREGSDTDHKGVIAGPPAWYFGFRPAPEQVETGPDRVLFELRKFVRLAAGGNPTLLEILFTDPSDHVVVTPGGARLLAERDAFLSRRVAESFGGYALAQLKRIRTHRRWLLSPPERPPTRAEYGLPAQAMLPRDQIGAAETLVEHGEVDLSPNFLDLLERERRYRGAKKQWAQYQDWLRTRNPQRAALEARFGYDTKHALHLVRLLRMAVEILETGRVVVRRPDREELLSIRDGAWSYDDLMARAEALGERVRAVVATSPLPAAPDEAKLDALCIEILSAEVRP
jgi:predicted nucleotidyltransferase